VITDSICKYCRLHELSKTIVFYIFEYSINTWVNRKTLSFCYFMSVHPSVVLRPTSRLSFRRSWILEHEPTHLVTGQHSFSFHCHRATFYESVLTGWKSFSWSHALWYRKITVILKRVQHSSLTWARWIQSTPYNLFLWNVSPP
jgi:hypothetical protein